MAINAAYFLFLMDVLKLLEARGRSGPVATACLSYPDILVSHANLSQKLSPEALASLPRRTDSQAVRKHHGYPEDFGDIAETTGLFRLLGMDPVYFDIAALRGGEIIIDLNEELPEELQEQFDLVLDTGTLEHCFNVGMAFKSMCSMVKKGGVVMTSGPLSMPNHGFWNFSPTAYYDFFTQNGFKILKLVSLAGPVQEDMVEVHPVERFTPLPQAGILCIAKRMEVQPFRWPVQWKYQGLIQN